MSSTEKPFGGVNKSDGSFVNKTGPDFDALSGAEPGEKRDPKGSVSDIIQTLKKRITKLDEAGGSFVRLLDNGMIAGEGEERKDCVLNDIEGALEEAKNVTAAINDKVNVSTVNGLIRDVEEESKVLKEYLETVTARLSGAESSEYSDVVIKVGEDKTSLKEGLEQIIESFEGLKLEL